LLAPPLAFSDGSGSIAFVEAHISTLLYPVLLRLLMFFAFSWMGEFTFKVWKSTLS